MKKEGGHDLISFGSFVHSISLSFFSQLLISFLFPSFICKCLFIFSHLDFTRCIYLPIKICSNKWWTTNTMCIRNLDRLNLIWLFDFRLEPIITSAPGASKQSTFFKSGQKWPKYSHLALKLYQRIHPISGVHNSNLKAGQKKFRPYSRAKIICFYQFRGCNYQENKLKTQNFVLRWPNSKLLRATFGPRAGCCACLL